MTLPDLGHKITNIKLRNAILHSFFLVTQVSRKSRNDQNWSLEFLKNHHLNNITTFFSIRHRHSTQNQCRLTPTLKFVSPTLDTSLQPDTDGLIWKSHLAVRLPPPFMGPIIAWDIVYSSQDLSINVPYRKCIMCNDLYQSFEKALPWN